MNYLRFQILITFLHDQAKPTVEVSTHKISRVSNIDCFFYMILGNALHNIHSTHSHQTHNHMFMEFHRVSFIQHYDVCVLSMRQRHVAAPGVM